MIEKYLENPKYGIYASLLDMQMNSLIGLGRFSEASELLTTINKVFPLYNHNSYTVSKYMICNEVEKAEEILKGQEYDFDTAYNYGKVYSLEGRYEDAKKHFLYAANNHELVNFRNKARENLIKISNYYRLGAYVPRDYKYFKKNGGKLRVADVIYVDELLGEYNAERIEKDSTISSKPYLIWKIIGNKIYAFPMTLINNGGYTLLASKYPNTGVNRYVIPYLLTMEESHVNKIVDHIHAEDFYSIIKSLYHRILINGKDEIINNLAFTNSIARDIWVTEGKVLSIFSKEENAFHNYYVLNIYDNDYKVVEVSLIDGIWQVIGDYMYISRNTYFYDVYNIDIDNKSVIKKQLSDKIKKKIK